MSGLTWGKRLSTPDIFLSYNREDAARAKSFADAFGAEGLSVWWDVDLRSGEAYDEVTEAALRNAKAVVVLWSPRSVESRWVRAEATLADRKRTLMPAMIEPCDRPIMFELVQTAELSHWRGDRKDPAWRAFAKQVCDVVGKDVTALNSDSSAEQLPRLDQVSVVVLPFTNMSKDEEQEYFADGITEDVITDLSKVSALKVIARNTAFTFKGKAVDIGDVARQLNVTHVVEGSIRKAGNRIRVTAQLIDGSDASHVWAERYNRDLVDIFDLQDELSQAIVKALKVKLLPSERKAMSERGTDSHEAYDLYLRARALENQNGAEPLTRATSLLRKAIELDPQFLPALSYLAEALTHSLIPFPERYESTWHEIAQIEARASAIAPNDPLVLILRASRVAMDRDYLEVERLLQQLPKNYQNGPFWSLEGIFNGFVGRFEEALQAARNWVRINPLDFLLAYNYRELHEITGDVEGANSEYERSKDIPGDRGFVEMCHLMRMKARATKEQIDEQYRRFLISRGPEMRISLFDELTEVLQDREQAIALVRAAIDNPKWQDPTRQIWFAFLAGFYDATDDCIKALRRAFVEKNPILGIRIYLWMPVLRPAHLDPRFKDILRDMKLVEYWQKTGKWGDFVRPVGDGDFEILTP